MVIMIILIISIIIMILINILIAMMILIIKLGCHALGAGAEALPSEIQSLGLRADRKHRNLTPGGLLPSLRVSSQSSAP